MRRLSLLLVVATAGAGGGAFAMEALHADAEQRALSLSISPARQAVAPGQQVSFGLGIAGRRGPVALSAPRLPQGLTVSFRLASGARSRVVPPGDDGAVVTLTVSRRASVGTKHVRIKARSAGRTRVRSARLTVVSRPGAILSIEARPTRLVLPTTGTGAYRIELHGRGAKRPRLRVRGLPSGVRATWSAAARGRRRLRIRVGRDADVGTSRLVIYSRRRQATRSAVVWLTVLASHPLTIGGDLEPLLYPGRSEPLELVLTNPNEFSVEVTGLHVAIRPGTGNPGCGSENYAVTQYRGPIPLTLRPGTTPLRELVADRSLWPRLSMLNLPLNQDACKHARLTLDYSGGAVR